MKNLIATLALTLALAGGTAKGADLENTLIMQLTYGRVVIEMRPDLAPKHVARIKELVRQGFYDGTPFHRVIEGFMAQGGDPTGTGTGGSGKKLPAEFSNEKHVRGTVSMARSADPNSADSQFFIVFQDAPWLDGKYTIWGKVTEGMEFVDKIKRGEGQNGIVQNPDKIVSMKVAADVRGYTLSDPHRGRGA
jgi:peptidylprolyl isomerase